MDMNTSSGEFEGLLRQAAAGEQQAVAALFDQYRERLRRMVSLRMDQRLRGRLGTSDVLQEAFLDMARRLQEYAALADYPFFLWLRQLVGQRLIDLHRQHLSVQKRSVDLEVSLSRVESPEVSADSLAGMLVDRLSTASQIVELAELQEGVRAALEQLPVADREILAMRHFEMLTNGECARILGLNVSAASKRYLRALRRIRTLLEANPGFPDIFSPS